jgi:exocyst complex component 6
VERRAEAIATAFGWYRCWVDNSSLLVDPIEFADFESNQSTSASRHGLSGSRHGLGGSRHGLRGGLGGSRHGKGRTLGFRATTSSRSQAYQEISSTLGTAAVKSTQRSKWCDLLTPEILNNDSPTR